jgi:hypothetical protein
MHERQTIETLHDARLHVYLTLVIVTLTHMHSTIDTDLTRVVPVLNMPICHCKITVYARKERRNHTLRCDGRACRPSVCSTISSVDPSTLLTLPFYTCKLPQVYDALLPAKIAVIITYP